MDSFANCNGPKVPASANLMADRRSIPPFASLRAFEAVGRAGSIRRAAQELRLDHAVVSRHLRAIEAWLGLSLFARSSPTLKLNAVGRQYHEEISAGLGAIIRATRDIVRVGDAGSLLIWSVPGFASRWLSANLDHFCTLHADIDVELRPTDASPDFISDEADGDIRFVRDISGAAPPSGVEWVTLARPKVFPVASPEWLAAHPTRGEPEDFLDMKLLHEENDEDWRGWLAANEVKAGPGLAGPRLWHAHLTLDAARRGQGVALTNPFLIADDLRRGVLAPVTNQSGNANGAAIGSYVFGAREDGAPRPALRKMRAWIVERAAAFLTAADARQTGEAMVA